MIKRIQLKELDLTSMDIYIGYDHGVINMPENMDEYVRLALLQIQYKVNEIITELNEMYKLTQQPENSEGEKGRCNGYTDNKENF